MKVPNIVNEKFIDENGFLTNPWKTVLSTLITQMQIHLSDEGFMLPTQSTVNINQLAIPEKHGALLIDSDTNEVKININGTKKKFTLT